jgi:hypothetical protein
MTGHFMTATRECVFHDAALIIEAVITYFSIAYGVIACGAHVPGMPIFNKPINFSVYLHCWQVSCQISGWLVFNKF